MSFFSVNTRKFIVGAVAGALLLGACGSANSAPSRQRNTALPTAIPVKYERSTVCTNFYGAYNKDMSADGAEVTLRFCPDATRYVLEWADGSSNAAQVNAQNDRVTIPGQDFISKGKLKVQVFRDALSAEDSSIIASVPLGNFELITNTIDGSTQLIGNWIAMANHTFMYGVSRNQVAAFSAMPIFIGHVFDQLIWFTRDRCRATMPSSESEAFNLQMSYETLPTTYTGWAGTASVMAKNANAPLANRRAMFRSFNLFQQWISGTSVESTNAATFTSSCSEVVEPLADSLTEVEKKNLEVAAPLLRQASREFDAAVCRGSYYSENVAQLLATVLETVPQVTYWRFSNEPDKGALEAAQFRLMYFGFMASEIQGTISNFYGCGHQSWGQEVWTEQQIDWYLNPTTTSSPVTTSTSTSTTGAPISGQEPASPSPENTSTLPENSAISSKNVQAVQVPPALVVGRKLSNRNIATLAGLAIPKGNTLKVTVAKGSQTICKASNTAVTGKLAGTCQLKVGVLKRKKIVKTSVLTLQVGK